VRVSNIRHTKGGGEMRDSDNAFSWNSPTRISSYHNRTLPLPSTTAYTKPSSTRPSSARKRQGGCWSTQDTGHACTRPSYRQTA
jgi:hypothetical protein